MSLTDCTKATCLFHMLKIPLHDIGLVNSCDFVSALFGGIIEGKLGDPSGLFSGYYLQTLNHSCNTLKKSKICIIYKTAIPNYYYGSEE